MAILFEIDLEKIKRAAWGHGDKLALALGVTKRSLSRKLNRKQILTIGEINQLIEVLDLDVRDLISYFTPVENDAKIL